MEITTTCRRFKMTPDIKEFAEKRISKLSRYFDSIQEAHLVLEQEKYRQIAELTVHVSGSELISRDQNADMLASIDRVVSRMERQIKKHSSRLKERKPAARLVPPGTVVEESELPDVEAEEEFSPVVVRMNWYAQEPLTVEEAIEFMHERDWDFLLFSNSRSGARSVLYQRDDGNYGLVAPD